MKIRLNGTANGSHSQMISDECKYEDNHVYLETAGRNLLFEKGFSIDAQIKIVKEGEEPVQLLKHLSCFLLDKDLEMVGSSYGENYTGRQDL